MVYNIGMTKQCTKCDKITESLLFPRDPSRKKGRSSWCKRCVSSNQKRRRKADISFRDYHATADREWRKSHPTKKKEYDLKARCKRVGITPEYYTTLPKKCSFLHCKSEEAGGNGDWHLDHDHVTNRFRGLLCHRHNAGLGHFNDSIEDLQDAIAYLISSRGIGVT